MAASGHHNPLSFFGEGFLFLPNDIDPFSSLARSHQTKKDADAWHADLLPRTPRPLGRTDVHPPKHTRPYSSVLHRQGRQHPIDGRANPTAPNPPIPAGLGDDRSICEFGLGHSGMMPGSERTDGLTGPVRAMKIEALHRSPDCPSRHGWCRSGGDLKRRR